MRVNGLCIYALVAVVEPAFRAQISPSAAHLRVGPDILLASSVHEILWLWRVSSSSTEEAALKEAVEDSSSTQLLFCGTCLHTMPSGLVAL